MSSCPKLARGVVPAFRDYFPVNFLGSALPARLRSHRVWRSIYHRLSLTTQHLSPLLVLAFTVERYVAVCHPFYGERISSTRRAVCTTLVLTVAALLINVVQAYFWTYSSATGICQLRPEVLSAYTSNFILLDASSNQTEKSEKTETGRQTALCYCCCCSCSNIKKQRSALSYIGFVARERLNVRLFVFCND